MKVLHFVTGGFSGATRVAMDLVAAHSKLNDTENPDIPAKEIECLLVLRRKKNTTPDKLQTLSEAGINHRVVTGSSHGATIYQLKLICEAFKPDVLVAHGFPEHLIGRWAGLWANVPHLVQVEHNSKERYTPWRLWQSRFLSRHSSLIIAVSQGVAGVLEQQQLEAPIVAIPNGIDTTKFGGGNLPLITARAKDIIMVGRFAKSKDHSTLIKALHILKQQGIVAHLTLIGSGRKYYKNQAIKLIDKLLLSDQVNIIDYSSEVHRHLLEHKIFVMSSNFEGLNLSVLEAMASGCVVVGSDAVGVAELIENSVNGLLFPIGNASRLAEHLAQVLANPQKYQTMANTGRITTMTQYDKRRVSLDYQQVFADLVQDKQINA